MDLSTSKQDVPGEGWGGLFMSSILKFHFQNNSKAGCIQRRPRVMKKIHRPDNRCNSEEIRSHNGRRP